MRIAVKPTRSVETAAMTGDKSCRSVLQIITGSVDGHVRVFDWPTKRLVHDLTGHRERVAGLALTPDERRVLSTGTDGTVRIWDLEAGRLIRTFEEHSEMTNRSAVSPDGRWVLSSGDDDAIRLWELETGEVAQIFHSPGFGCAVGFSPDGKRIVINHGSDLKIMPFLPYLWQQDPQALVEEAEREVGLRLEGLELVPAARAVE